uniref:Uncharacterized protein n=1 Tax=Ficedula albicollis TaxID=59894 RepID=A0A803VSC0_FICAL
MEPIPSLQTGTCMICKWSRYPPGPASLPFIGTMLSIDFHKPYHSFSQVSGSPRTKHSTYNLPWVLKGWVRAGISWRYSPCL